LPPQPAARAPPFPSLNRSPPFAQIYPGTGKRFVSRSGQLTILFGSKAAAMFHQRKKPAKLMWTQAWRRMHKKNKVEEGGKRKVRKVAKVAVVRNFEGMNAEEVRVTPPLPPPPFSPSPSPSPLHTCTRLPPPPPLPSCLLTATPLSPLPAQVNQKKKAVVVVKKVAASGEKKAAEPVSQAQIAIMKAKAKEQRASRMAKGAAGGGAKHAGKGR
jgi:ribosomal protein L24E